MQCDRCGNKESVVHLTQIENNQMTTSHLCEDCAAAQGVDAGSGKEAAPLAEFLAGMGTSLGETFAGACPSCGLSAAEFKRKGRLGCAQCYAHFAGQLRPLLRKLHGGARHRGKPYVAPEQISSDDAARAEHLRRTLARAVEAEDYERAAALRDELRELDSGPGSA